MRQHGTALTPQLSIFVLLMEIPITIYIVVCDEKDTDKSRMYQECFEDKDMAESFCNTGNEMFENLHFYIYKKEVI